MGQKVNEEQNDLFDELKDTFILALLNKLGGEATISDKEITVAAAQVIAYRLAEDKESVEFKAVSITEALREDILTN